MSESSLALQGWRMPAEWEPHAATWLSWPHNKETWPDRDFRALEDIWAQMAAALAPGEIVNLLAPSALHGRVGEALAKRSVPEARVRIHDVPTNDVWARDHGPIFVTRGEGAKREKLILNWEYNAWGGKFPPWDDDNRVPGNVAKILGLNFVSPSIILEGGSIDVNGRGTLITTEQCLLNKNRNPSLTRAQIEQKLRDHLGVTNILWLHNGLEGDDTDGHVDDITRFVAERTIVTVMCEEKRDANHATLLENRQRLETMRDQDGKAFDVVELPMPVGRIDLNEDRRLPASYGNFYIGNAAVLLPVFDDPNDGRAADILAPLFPGRRIVPIDCRLLIEEGGALHCVSQQEPA